MDGGGLGGGLLAKFFMFVPLLGPENAKIMCCPLANCNVLPRAPDGHFSAEGHFQVTLGETPEITESFELLEDNKHGPKNQGLLPSWNPRKHLEKQRKMAENTRNTKEFPLEKTKEKQNAKEKKIRVEISVRPEKPKWGFGVAMLPVGASCFCQVHFGRTVLPKWPLWAHLFYTVFYSVSELKRACFRQARVARAVLPPGALFRALAFCASSMCPKSHLRPLPHFGFSEILHKVLWLPGDQYRE